MLQESPDYQFSPYDLPVEEYWGLVQIVNQHTIEQYRDFLATHTTDLNQAIVLVGSDGKRERHSQSRTEFVILTEKQDLSRTSQVLTNKLLSKEFPIHYELGPDGFIEVKCLADEMPLSYAYADPNRVYPDRTLNITRVAGNSDITHKARRIALEEMSLNSQISGRIQERMKEQLRQYRQTMKTGSYRNVPVFSVEHAVQYYDEHAPLRFGFKMGFLRAVQRKLDLITANMVREGSSSIDALAQVFPVTTVDRIGFFARYGIIPHNLEDPLCEAYLWFLREYHRAQESYKRNQRAVETPFDSSLMQVYRGIVLDFV